MNTLKLEAELSRMIAKGWDDPRHESNFWYVRAKRILEHASKEIIKYDKDPC